jgi:isopentenyl diphosphate isomerase/L-lactate dehydrogenase-like FMN-dependent dehydrogenase
MKRLIVAFLAMAVAAAFTVNAAEEAKKPAPKHTPEQQALMKEMIAKYDTNGDKKLDKEERAKISAADKEKMKAAGIGQGHEKKKAE